MKLLILIISLLYINNILGDNVPGYGIWNGDENNIVIGKLDLSLNSPSYSTIFNLQNHTLIDSNDNPLSTYNKNKNTIYFLTNNINNNTNGYLYSYNFNSDELNLVMEYLTSDYEFYAIESAHSSSDFDLFIVYKNNNYVAKNKYYCGSLSQLYKVPVLFDPIEGDFLSATYNTKRETFDVISINNNKLILSSYLLLGMTYNKQELKLTNFKNNPLISTTSRLSYSSDDSSIYGIMNVKDEPQIIKINGYNIVLLNWMDNNNSKLIKQYTVMNTHNSILYQSVIYFDNTFGINLLNNNGIINSIQTPFLLNNFWFI